MACDCISTVNADLAKLNTELVTTLFGNPMRAVVRTEQKETGRGKKKAVAMIASFCPFCGEKYVASEV